MARIDSQIVTSGDRFVPPGSSRTWKEAVRDAVRDPLELSELLELPADAVEPAVRAAAATGFSLFVPREYLGRIEPRNVNDPLLRQILPCAEELATEPARFRADPVDDLAARKAPGLLQKYAGRALLLLSSSCPVHCRYCFRRVFLAQGPQSWGMETATVPAETLAWIEDHMEIGEVILSGGDPLMLVDESLALLVDRLSAIEHVATLRIHTRMPVMIPQRITKELVDSMSGGRLQVVVVVHSNHPAEWDDTVIGMARKLSERGVMMWNQSVLLRGINDSAETLASLSRRLLAARVVPYYLHQLDPVSGAAHFEVPVAEGRRLVASLRAMLPGYAVPRYVVERPGAPNKLPLA